MRAVLCWCSRPAMWSYTAGLLPQCGQELCCEGSLWSWAGHWEWFTCVIPQPVCAPVVEHCSWLCREVILRWNMWGWMFGFSSGLSCLTVAIGSFTVYLLKFLVFEISKEAISEQQKPSNVTAEKNSEFFQQWTFRVEVSAVLLKAAGTAYSVSYGERGRVLSIYKKCKNIERRQMHFTWAHRVLLKIASLYYWIFELFRSESELLGPSLVFGCIRWQVAGSVRCAWLHVLLSSQMLGCSAAHFHFSSVIAR